MKKRGRFIVEASCLVPLICMLLVLMVYFTLYAHDYAVCAHAAIECGVKELCQKGQTDREIREQIYTGLEEKLSGRLLWMQSPEIEVEVGVLRVTVQISGTGRLLPDGRIQLQQSFVRINPCETVRRVKWLRK